MTRQLERYRAAVQIYCAWLQTPQQNMPEDVRSIAGIEFAIDERFR